MSAEDPFRAKFSKDCSIAGGPHYLKGQIPHSLWPIFFVLPWSQRVNFYFLSSGVIYSSCSAYECKICFHQKTHKCVYILLDSNLMYKMNLHIWTLWTEPMDMCV